MKEVKHPHWQCPRCGIVIRWAGANSHDRCRVGDEPWRKVLREAAR